MSFEPTSLENLSPAELNQRRTELVKEIGALPGSYNEAPTEKLQELAFIYGALRRKTAGPPAKAKASKRSGDSGLTDAGGLADLLG